MLEQVEVELTVSPDARHEIALQLRSKRRFSPLPAIVLEGRRTQIRYLSRHVLEGPTSRVYLINTSPWPLAVLDVALLRSLHGKELHWTPGGYVLRTPAKS